jgi:hypothetical protein
VHHLDLALCILMDGEGVDHSYRVALPEPLELLDDLTVKVRLVEAQDEQLYWTYRHGHSFDQ